MVADFEMVLCKIYRIFYMTWQPQTSQDIRVTPYSGQPITDSTKQQQKEAEEALAPVNECESIDIETCCFKVIETLCPASSHQSWGLRNGELPRIMEGQSFSFTPGGSSRRGFRNSPSSEATAVNPSLALLPNAILSPPTACR